MNKILVFINSCQQPKIRLFFWKLFMWISVEKLILDVDNFPKKSQNFICIFQFHFSL